MDPLRLEHRVGVDSLGIVLGARSGYANASSSHDSLLLGWRGTMNVEQTTRKWILGTEM